jgi:transcriptional regulator with XRE-family HTH domain
MMLRMTSGAKQSKEGVARRVPRRGAKRDPASMALIELRKVLKMSQAEFAIKLMDVAPITVYRLETGTVPPRGDTLLRLAEVADYAANYLILDNEHAEELRDRFLDMYLDDALDRIGVEFIPVVKDWLAEQEANLQKLRLQRPSRKKPIRS